MFGVMVNQGRDVFSIGPTIRDNWSTWWNFASFMNIHLCESLVGHRVDLVCHLVSWNLCQIWKWNPFENLYQLFFLLLLFVCISTFSDKWNWKFWSYPFFIITTTHVVNVPFRIKPVNYVQYIFAYNVVAEYGYISTNYIL